MADMSVAFEAFGGPAARNTGESAAALSAAEELMQSYEVRLALAESDPLRAQSHRLRYQVYCIENPFEPISANPGGMETDEYDTRSLHSVMMERTSGAVVGTVRLIVPEANGSAFPLPIHRLCAPEFLEPALNRIPDDRAAEISRFAIAKALRRRPPLLERRSDDPGGPGKQKRGRAIPQISVGLMQAIVAMARLREITHLYAVMDPALLRMLRHLGLHFENLGPVVDYHGRRQPCFCDLDQLLSTCSRERPDIWTVLTATARYYAPPKQQSA